MVSSGIRLGAWDILRWGHIIPIKKDGNIVAAKVIVYAEDEEQYVTFITPEAYNALEEWIVYRKECGETITKDSWVMRNLWDVTTPIGKGIVTVPKQLKSTGIKRLIERALWAQGVRKKLTAGKKRHEFQADHGFRKWFKTTELYHAHEESKYWSTNYTIDRLKEHLARTKHYYIKEDGKTFEARKYYYQAFDLLKIGAFKPIPSFVISLSDFVDDRRLLKELHDLDRETLEYVLLQAVGRLYG